LPYFLIVAFQFNETEQLANIAVNCFFICGTLVILFVTRIFNENLRQKELESKLALENELRHREIVIEQKSEQALRYRSLSRQFSPQVVKAIEVGEVRIDERVHNASICCLFVDIVNSTNRVTRIEKDSVDKVITMFMDDVAKTFLRFDLTIDKFLGDGVLAFSNDPVEYEDYVERAVQAAIELKARIENRHTVYESYWLNDFQIRVGLAKGVANVGFYGSENIYHSYTAIGPVVNLASRLCSVAEPNQIVTSFSVIESLEIDNYKINPIGEKNLKGFEEDRIKIFSIEGYQQKEKTGFDISDCPECSSILHIETSTKGIYILKCRSCGLEVDENTAIERSWKAS
jgi:adenylate cyclase